MVIFWFVEGQEVNVVKQLYPYSFIIILDGMALFGDSIVTNAGGCLS